jgi:hypothetical protein
MLAGTMILIFGTSIFDPHSIQARILTHTLTLGVMLSFMFAALFQMLPVIAGVTLTAPIQKANWLQYPFLLGTLLLLAAFSNHFSWLYNAASLLLGGSIFYTVSMMLKHLFALTHHSSSSRGMILAILSLAIVTVLALYMTTTLSGNLHGVYFSQIKEGHYSFGIFGWISLLIIAISFQVIEMFYVTPPYPKIVSHYLPPTLFGILSITVILGLFFPSVWTISNILLLILLGSYALLTLLRLTQKKRPLSDATIWFWRTGLISLLFAIITLLFTLFIDNRQLQSATYLFFAFFALSIVFAMFYKIIPFLTWFHLNSQGYFTAPMMHEVIHPKTANKHLHIHLVTLCTFIVSLFITPLIYPAALLTLLSFGWMTYQIIHAWDLYKLTQRTGKKFEMKIPS